MNYEDDDTDFGSVTAWTGLEIAGELSGAAL